MSLDPQAMRTVSRYDYSALRVTRTPGDGYKIDAYISRVGIQVYTLADGTTRREFRPAEEVFAPASLASFGGATLTDDHPVKMVSPDNWSEVSIGHVDQPVQEGDYAKARIHLNDAEAIRKFEAGELKECSCGYYADYYPMPGTYNGEPYDGIQRNIRGNHVALGPEGWGRAGPKVALITDSELNLRSGENSDSIGESFLTHPYGDSADQTNPHGEGLPEMKETIDGVEYVVGSPEHVAKLKSVAARAKQDAADATKALETTSTELTTAKTAVSTATARADAAEKQLTAIKREQLIQILLRKDSTFTREIADKKDAPMDLSALVARALKILLPNYNAEGKTPEQLGEALEIAIGMAGGEPAAGGEPDPDAVSADTVTEGGLGSEDVDKPPVAQDATHAGRGSRSDSPRGARLDANAPAQSIEDHARLVREKRARLASFGAGPAGVSNPHPFGS